MLLTRGQPVRVDTNALGPTVAIASCLLTPRLEAVGYETTF
jgi:hypothetical protein